MHLLFTLQVMVIAPNHLYTLYHCTGQDAYLSGLGFIDEGEGGAYPNVAKCPPHSCKRPLSILAPGRLRGEYGSCFDF